MKCPTCKKVVDPKTTPAEHRYFLPFCSERCQLVDLGRWIGEEYRIPGEPVSPEDLPTQDDKS